MADNTQVDDSVQVGQVYKAREGGKEVIPYFLDSASARVNFAPVGRSAEETTFAPEFLKQYALFGPLSSQAEKPGDAKDNPDEPVLSATAR